jgi:two-component system chemotaxis response regulator CheY
LTQIGISDIAILLVEPSVTQQKIIIKQFSQLTADKVTVVGSGEEAIASILVSEPDVVISAFYLPDMTGTDLVHHIRKSDQIGNIGFILISSETRFRYLDPIRQAGAIAIVPKPFALDELRIAMSNTLEFLDPQSLSLEQFNPEELEVLIVDDSALARRHIRGVLSGLGMERFTEAKDGVEALGILSDHYFDLVVTDYNMPNMDGKELVDHIRKGEHQASVPVMMVTSENNQNRLAAVQKAGVSAICDKPFETGNVRDLIQQLMA